MAEEKKEPWLNWMALTTVIFAVCATLATFKGGGFSTKSLINQAFASDQWSFFQSKKIKSDLYELQKDNLELNLKANPPTDSLVKSIYQAKLADYSKKITRYKAEMDTISGTAKTFEKNRDQFQKHSTAFGMAVIFLQITILLSSIAALLKRRELWILGLVLGLGGIAYFIDGFLLLF